MLITFISICPRIPKKIRISWDTRSFTSAEPAISKISSLLDDISNYRIASLARDIYFNLKGIDGRAVRRRTQSQT
jgi:hypothetical protein